MRRQKPLSIPTRLYNNIKNISICVDCAPQPVPLATDRDYAFIHVPLVVRSRSTPADAICKVATKTIDSQPDRFPADNNAPRCQKVFNISRAHADGVYFKPRMTEEKQCVLVVVGADEYGRKELLAMTDGFHESTQSPLSHMQACVVG